MPPSPWKPNSNNKGLVPLRLSRWQLATAIALIWLGLEQASKLWVRTHMVPGESIEVLGTYFQIFFIENNGMAFGIEWGGRTGKLVLTLFRLAAVLGLGFYFRQVMLGEQCTHAGAAAMALIWSGACGNIVDSVFYGKLFGYEDFLYGRVVDMLYFPVYQGFVPSWLPIWGGEYLVFFRPVFNLADTGITFGVGLSLFFYQRLFPPSTHPLTS